MVIEFVAEEDHLGGDGDCFLYSPDRVAARTKSEASQ